MVSQTGYRLGYRVAQPPKIQFLLSPMGRAYLREIVKLGIYGTGEQAVARRLVERAIAEAVEKGLIQPKSKDDFAEGETEADEKP
jgi:hypothetical protein